MIRKIMNSLTGKREDARDSYAVVCHCSICKMRAEGTLTQNSAISLTGMVIVLPPDWRSESVDFGKNVITTIPSLVYCPDCVRSSRVAYHERQLTSLRETNG